jgi:DNA-binding NtrC family response regulator
LERACKEFGHRPLALSRQQAALLKRYGWPGNVRELKNVIERAVILSQGKVLRLDLAMPDVADSGAREPTADLPESGERVLTETQVRELERDNLRKALRLTNWRVSGQSGAAHLLGIKPTTLTDRIRKYGITRPRTPDNRS